MLFFQRDTKAKTEIPISNENIIVIENGRIQLSAYGYIQIIDDKL